MLRAPDFRGRRQFEGTSSTECEDMPFGFADPRHRTRWYLALRGGDVLDRV